MRIKNVKTLPTVYYGIHFSEGCAQYTSPDGSYKIFINEDTIRRMDKSFAGRPLYINHVDEVNLHNLKEEADGYVVKSFKNPLDGKTWAQFIVITDEAKELIRKGWKLSNGYFVKAFGPPGEWHGIPYEREIVDAEYEHLAIVENPRYAESIIYTEEEFKLYNEQKEQDLKKVENSKGEKKMKFNFFKKEKVNNSTDLENMLVVLPKSKKEISIERLINDADEAVVKENSGEMPMAEGKHLVLVGNDKMSVEDLMKNYLSCKNELEEMKKNSDDEEAKKKAADEEAKKNEADEEAKKKALEDAKRNEEEEEKKKQNSKDKNFDSLKNANTQTQPQGEVLLTQSDRMALGKQRYGSN